MEGRTVWWLHPAWVVGGFSGVIVILAHLLPARTYLFSWRTPKFLDQESLVLMLLCIACFVIGTLLVDFRPMGFLRRARQSEPALATETLSRLSHVSCALTFFGYLVWTGVALKRGLNFGVLVELLRGENGIAYTMREKFLGNITGITTCTQFGMSTVVLALLLGRKLTKRSVFLLFVPFGLLTFARALVNSERLALVEVAVPAGVLLIRLLVNRVGTKPAMRSLLSVLPLLGLGVLFLVFGAFEYFRSWLTFYARGDQSFWEFAASRLLGYYVTALNNGALILHFIAAPIGAPFQTLSFLWRFPGLKELADSVFPLSVNFSYFDFLARNANPEFNNADGLLLPVLDFGILGGLLYWAGVGVLCGSLYRRFRLGDAWGLCLYPLVYVTLLEVPRGLHWGDGRAFPPYCFLIVSAFLLRVRQLRTRPQQVSNELASRVSLLKSLTAD
jgi:hypothetical protein